MKGLRLAIHPGSFIRELGGYGPYHKYCIKNKLATKRGSGIQAIISNKIVGRNDPCPCGATNNGKPVKYKKCCLKHS